MNDAKSMARSPLRRVLPWLVAGPLLGLVVVAGMAWRTERDAHRAATDFCAGVDWGEHPAVVAAHFAEAGGVRHANSNADADWYAWPAHGEHYCVLRHRNGRIQSKHTIHASPWWAPG
jgi:hypothetical protein